MYILLALCAIAFHIIFFWKWKKNTQNFYLESRPIIFGHRGSPTYITENTAPSFKKALNQGAEGFEFDIRLTKDKKIIIFHDSNLLRMSGISIKIKETNHETLKAHNLKKETNQEESVKIPLLEDILETIDQAQAINIEIKSDALFEGQETLLPLIEFLNKHQIDHKCIVSSFNPLILWRLKRKRPQTTTGLLYASRYYLHSIYNMILILICRPENLHIHHDFLDSWIVKWARFKGMRVNGYTINNKAAHERAKKLKIDGIFTDNIEYLK